MNFDSKELYLLSKKIQSREYDPKLEEEFLKILLKQLKAQFCFYAVFNEIINEVKIERLASLVDNNPRIIHPESEFIDECDCIYKKCIDKKELTNLSTSKDQIICKINLISEEVKSILAVPLIRTNKLIGVLAAVNKNEGDSFSRIDEQTISIFTLVFALYLENRNLHEENKKNEMLLNLGQSIINSAHGLKNLLNNIDGGVYIVERGTAKKDMEQVAKGWDILRRNSNRVRDLVLDILLFSRPKKPEYSLNNINDICKDIKELIIRNAADSKVELKLDLGYKITPSYFDPKGIYRCILNLVSNALSACEYKAGGRVTIKTRQIRDESILISVSDTGTGIAPENIDSIFDTFFTTKGSKGTGLGLSVTKKIINEHNGKIKVESLPNVGTTFTIKIPLHYTNFKSEEENGNPG